MSYRAVTTPVSDADVDVLFVPLSGPRDPMTDLPWIDAATRGEIGRARASSEFKGRLFDVFVTPVVEAGCKARRIAVIGGGDPAERTAERWRRIAATCAHAARGYAAGTCGFVVRGTADANAAAIANTSTFIAPPETLDSTSRHRSGTRKPRVSSTNGPIAGSDGAESTMAPLQGG